jgi:hypothetical protein
MAWAGRQGSLLRFNCADSLDRTNAATCFAMLPVGGTTQCTGARRAGRAGARGLASRCQAGRTALPRAIAAVAAAPPQTARKERASISICNRPPHGSSATGPARGAAPAGDRPGRRKRRQRTAGGHAGAGRRWAQLAATAAGPPAGERRRPPPAPAATLPGSSPRKLGAPHGRG